MFAASCLVLHYLSMSPKMDARLKWVYFTFVFILSITLVVFISVVLRIFK